MKLILAIIRPEKLAAVQAALAHRDVRLLTVNEVFSYGREQGPVEIYRGRRVRRAVSKFRVEVMVEDSSLSAAVEAIRAAGFAGGSEPAGDDQLFVMGLAECARSGPQSSVEPCGPPAAC